MHSPACGRQRLTTPTYPGRPDGFFRSTSRPSARRAFLCLCRCRFGRSKACRLGRSVKLLAPIDASTSAELLNASTFSGSSANARAKKLLCLCQRFRGHPLAQVCPALEIRVHRTGMWRIFRSPGLGRISRASSALASRDTISSAYRRGQQRACRSGRPISDGRFSASISCTLTRSRLPLRCTEPSRT